MSKERRYVAVLLILLVLLAACKAEEQSTLISTVPIEPLPEETLAPTPFPTPEGPQARVADVINDVDAHVLPQGEWEDALEDMTIYVGGEVWAQEFSTARVEVSEGLVRVAPNTIFTFGQPDGETLQLNLEEGQIWLNVEDLAPGESFEVQTPTTVASVRGTRFSVRAAGDGATVVSTREDAVAVAAGGVVVTVTPGLETTVLPGMTPTVPYTMSVEEQVRWGMAIGDGLDVILPAVGDAIVISQTGKALSLQWTPGGDLFTYRYYDPIASEYGVVFYDLLSGEATEPNLPPGANSVILDPTGGGYAFQRRLGDDPEICVANMDGEDVVCWGGDAYYGFPYWSPDGEWILFYSDRGQSDPSGELWVMRADGTDPRMVSGGVEGGVRYAYWSPSGAWLAASAEENGLWLVRPDGSGAQVVPGTEGEYCGSQVWSPTQEGWPLFFYMSEGRYYVLDETGGPAFFVYEQGPYWSPAGDWVAFEAVVPISETFESTLYLFQAGTDFWP